MDAGDDEAMIRLLVSERKGGPSDEKGGAGGGGTARAVDPHAESESVGSTEDDQLAVPQLSTLMVSLSLPFLSLSHTRARAACFK